MMYDDDGNDELVTMTRSYAIISVASFEDEKDKIALVRRLFVQSSKTKNRSQGQ